MSEEYAPVNVDWEERENRLVDLLQPVFLATLYFASVVSATYGIVLGLVAVIQCKLPANKKVGTICLVLGAVNMVLVAALVVVYVALIMIIIFAAAGAAGAGAAGGA